MPQQSTESCEKRAQGEDNVGNWQTVNLNDMVKIKPTPLGKALFAQYYLGGLELECDKEGYATMQLWQVLRIFGPEIEMHFYGNKLPMALTMFIETAA